MPIENSCLKAIMQHKDVNKRVILKQLLSEFLGVLLLVLLAVGSHLATTDLHGDSVGSSVHVPLAVGLAVSALILCFHHVSGGHINPAVTCAVFSLGKPMYEMERQESFLNLFLEYSDVRRRTILTQLLAEFLGVFLLVVVAVGAHLATADPMRDSAASSVHVPFAVGLAIATLILCTHHASGGHLNPAVTCGVLVLGKMSLLRAILYILAQCVGGICGAALLQAMLPVGPGAHRLNSSIHPIQGFGIEFFITFVLVLTVVASVDPNRTDTASNSMPLAVGLAVLANCLFAGHWTGASMNPAVSFGLSVISNTWTDHWVYWLGPCVGGISAATLYWAALQAEEPARKPMQIPTNETLLSEYKLKEAAGQSGEGVA